jgi:hypothetical protein
VREAKVRPDREHTRARVIVGSPKTTWCSPDDPRYDRVGSLQLVAHAVVAAVSFEPGMRPRVISDLVTFGIDSTKNVGPLRRSTSDDEERGQRGVLGEDVQNRLRSLARPVVERQRDLL